MGLWLRLSTISGEAEVPNSVSMPVKGCLDYLNTPLSIVVPRVSAN